MLTTIRNAWKIKEIRTKLLYMLFVLLLIRVGTHLPVPGVDLSRLDANSSGTLYSLITGGQYGTIFAMGIGPYINASIIMQLLTVAIPSLEQIQKEGEEGRKKIAQITRFVTIGLALLQGCGQIYTVRGAFVNGNFFAYAVALLTMITGTVFIMWLGEQLTEKGIGNGSSFIIAANILSGLSAGVQTMYVQGQGSGVMGWIKVGKDPPGAPDAPRQANGAPAHGPRSRHKQY